MAIVTAETGNFDQAFEPIAINRAPRVQDRTIRVVVFNARLSARADGILACIRRPPLSRADVILLCEAAWRIDGAGSRGLASNIADALRMSFVYVPEFIRGQPHHAGWSIGNAIVCAQPLDEIRSIVLPSYKPNWRRVPLRGAPRGIAATASFGGRKLTIGVAHLNSRCSPELRARQMAVYLDGVAGGGPAIIGGDWNTTTVALPTRRSLAGVAARMALQPLRFRYPQAYEPLFAEIARRGFAIEGANRAGAPTFTFSRALPRLIRPKLDWIAARGVAPVERSAAVIPARPAWRFGRVSDHDFVICDFSV
jgi:endonuclease/exonuclease/phosphatase (EEP) superfamily protein YafD